MVLETIYVTRHGVRTLSDVFPSVPRRHDASWTLRSHFPFSSLHKERVGLVRARIVTASLTNVSSHWYSVAIQNSEASYRLHALHLFTAEKHTHDLDSSALIGWSTPLPAHIQAIFPHQLVLHQIRHWQPMA